MSVEEEGVGYLRRGLGRRDSSRRVLSGGTRETQSDGQSTLWVSLRSSWTRGGNGVPSIGSGFLTTDHQGRPSPSFLLVLLVLH